MSPHHQHFRCHIDHPGVRLGAAELFVRKILVRLRHISGIRDGRYIKLDEMASLVVYQGDKWGHDKGDPAGSSFGANRGQLI